MYLIATIQEMNNRIANKYSIGENIGSGCFGSVFNGTHYKTNMPVAIKMEDVNADVKILKNETTILKYLYDQGSRDIPIVYWFGLHHNNTCLVMSLYDCSLHDYIQQNPLLPNKIDVIMRTMINIFQFIHSKLVIHRDIKPQNIMLKTGELYLIDFGFATFYVDENSNHIVDDSSRQHIIGTPKYVSYHIHCGSLPSRRDDLISLGYIYMYLYNRKLQWDTIIEPDGTDAEYEDTHILNYKNKQRKVLKEFENIQPICAQINRRIENFLNYCYHIQYDDTPLYNALTDIFATDD
jgi:serine/threonine protein kinase